MDIQFRVTEHPGEILGLLGGQVGQESIIWQNLGPNNERTIFKIKSIEIIASIQTVKIFVDGPTHLIDPMKTFYLKLKEKNSLFKGNYLQHGPSSLTFFMPDEVTTQEFRDHPRTRFRPKDNKMATVVLSSELVSSATQSLRYSIIDISSSGISLLVSHKNIEFLKKSHLFLLTHLNNSHIADHIQMELKYIKEFQFKNKGRIVYGNRVGFKFLTPLPETMLDFITLKF